VLPGRGARSRCQTPRLGARGGARGLLVPGAWCRGSWCQTPRYGHLVTDASSRPGRSAQTPRYETPRNDRREVPGARSGGPLQGRGATRGVGHLGRPGRRPRPRWRPRCRTPRYRPDAGLGPQSSLSRRPMCPAGHVPPTRHLWTRCVGFPPRVRSVSFPGLSAPVHPGAPPHSCGHACRVSTRPTLRS